MAISESDVAAFIKHKEIKLVGDRLITIPKKREKGFFHVEMDVPEEEIDEILSNELIPRKNGTNYSWSIPHPIEETG